MKVIGSASTCNLTSILAYNYFFDANQNEFKGFSSVGKLTLPKPQFFTTDNKLLNGYASFMVNENGSEWGNKEQEDYYFYSHFPQTNLVRRDGTLLEERTGSMDSIPYVVMEAIEFSSHADATVQLEGAVGNFLNTHHSLPQKLIIPIGGCAHTSCLIIEPKDATSCTITALDSLASMGFGRPEAVTGAENALKNRFNSVSKVYNSWGQNNLFRCPTHVMLNVTIASEYSSSVYDLVKTANEKGTIPDQFKSRSEQELIDAYTAIREEVTVTFKEICRLNPEKIIVHRTDGNHYIENLIDLSN